MASGNLRWANTPPSPGLSTKTGPQILMIDRGQPGPASASGRTLSWQSHGPWCHCGPKASRPLLSASRPGPYCLWRWGSPRLPYLSSDSPSKYLWSLNLCLKFGKMLTKIILQIQRSSSDMEARACKPAAVIRLVSTGLKIIKQVIAKSLTSTRQHS